MITQTDFFGQSEYRKFKVDTLPVSVIEIGRSTTGHREAGGHNDLSSREDYSGFPREIGSLCYQLYLKNGSLVFDPFAGWGERARLAAEHGIQYIGYDVSPAAINSSRNRFGVSSVVLGSSHVEKIPCFDGLITCPPYWNLEIYSPYGIENCGDWGSFLDHYQEIWIRCYDAAKVGAVFCIYVGDWRKDGVYYDLTFQTQKIMYDLGATPIDSVIASRSSITKIKVMLPQALTHGYTVKVHETLLVFQKQ